MVVGNIIIKYDRPEIQYRNMSRRQILLEVDVELVIIEKSSLLIRIEMYIDEFNVGSIIALFVIEL